MYYCGLDHFASQPFNYLNWRAESQSGLTHENTFLVLIWEYSVSEAVDDLF